MISIGDVITLIEKGMSARNLYSTLKERKIGKFLSQSQKGRVKVQLYEFLDELYYDLDILTGPDGPFPVGILDVVDIAKGEPDKLLGALIRHPKEIKTLQRGVVDALQKRGAAMWNGKTFSLDSVSLNTQGKVEKVHACIGSYFDMVSSADYLELECLAAIESSQDAIGLSDLPARDKALSEFDTPGECLRAGGGIDAAIAISTLVVYLREGRYWLLCDVRSKKVAVHYDLYHVLPSFMFQPVTGTTDHALRVEWSITHNIYREYLEELFNIPEIEHTGKPVAPDFFYQHPNLLLLKKLIRDGSACVRGIAFAFNLLNHRPEICTLLLIKDESWYTAQKDAFGAKTQGLNHLSINNEFLTHETQDDQPHQEIVTTLPLEDNRWSQYVKPWLMVPQGAAALVLGAKTAVSILDLHEPTWLQRIHIREARDNPL